MKSSSMKGRLALAALTFLLPVPAMHAQRREFLSGEEINLVQEAQEPNDRLKLYAQFARVRLDAIDKEMAKEMSKANAQRGDAIHDLLYEYERIIDALDDVASLAETKRALVRRGLDTAVRAEPEFLKRLQALEDKNAADHDTYRFALSEAIESTKSSLEELRKLLAKQPTDKKLEKEIEKEAAKDAKERKKSEPK
jgi:hypothetical protein